MRIWKLAQTVMCGPCAVMVTNKSLDRWWSCSHWAGGVDSYWGEATFTPIGCPWAGQAPDWLVVSVIMADMQWTSLCQETHWAELLTTTTTANHCHLSMALILYHNLHNQTIIKVSIHERVLYWLNVSVFLFLILLCSYLKLHQDYNVGNTKKIIINLIFLKTWSRIQPDRYHTGNGCFANFKVSISTHRLQHFNSFEQIKIPMPCIIIRAWKVLLKDSSFQNLQRLISIVNVPCKNS